MKRVISFGDSFTAGLGIDSEYENSQLAGRHDWESLSEEEKHIERQKVSQWRHERSFTKLFADNFGVDYHNNGIIGCNNQDIVDTIFEFDFKYELNKDDFVLIGFTSSLRDKIMSYPKTINENIKAGLTWSIKELLIHAQEIKPVVWKPQHNTKVSKKYTKFTQYYIGDYISNIYDETYYKYFNLNTIHLIQKFLEYKNVNYIMFDAFENMKVISSKHINKKYYWGFEKETLWSYLNKFNDRLLYEKDTTNDHHFLHPSGKGHELFTKELIKFYESIYRI